MSERGFRKKFTDLNTHCTVPEVLGERALAKCLSHGSEWWIQRGLHTDAAAAERVPVAALRLWSMRQTGAAEAWANRPSHIQLKHVVRRHQCTP